MLSTERLRQLGLIALVSAGVCMALAIPHVDLAGLMVTPGTQWGADVIGYPLLVGLGFGGLVLAILWGGQWIRFLFEVSPTRIIGLFSYSLYLWHLPVIHGTVPLFAGIPLALAIAGAFLVSYLSYQLVERPFLLRRHRQSSSAVPLTAELDPVVVPVLAPASEANIKPAERIPTLV